MTKENSNLPAILVVGNFLSKAGGNCQACEELAIRLELGGHRVITTSSRKGRTMRLFGMLRTCWRQRRRYQVAHVSVFSGASFFWAEAVCWMLRRLGKPYVLALHGGDLPNFARKWPARVRRLLRSGAVVSSPSRYLQDHLRTIHPAILQLPNAIDLDRYEYRLRRRAAPKLVWLRAFHAIYNPSLAIRVIAALRNVYPDIELVMTGPDKGDGSLGRAQKLAANLGVSNAVSFPGAVSKADVHRVVNSGDIFINTTNADNTPVSVLEAMACGACVVSTNVGGIPYLLDHEKNALLVPPDDVEAMVAAVSRIIENPSLCERLSEAGRAKVAEMDWAEVLAVWQQLFARIVSPAPSPGPLLESRSSV